MAKRNYSDMLRIQFSSSDSASVWKGLKEITNYKTPSPSTVENQQLADNFNEFYCRFEKKHQTPALDNHSTQPLTPGFNRTKKSSSYIGQKIIIIYWPSIARKTHIGPPLMLKHSLFELLPSGRHYRALSTRTTRHRNSFLPQAIHLMSS